MTRSQADAISISTAASSQEESHSSRYRPRIRISFAESTRTSLPVKGKRAINDRRDGSAINEDARETRDVSAQCRASDEKVLQRIKNATNFRSFVQRFGVCRGGCDIGIFTCATTHAPLTGQRCSPTCFSTIDSFDCRSRFNLAHLTHESAVEFQLLNARSRN